MLKWIVLPLLALYLTGCVSVYPQTRAVEPTRVYLTDYGIHSSLIIPNGDGRYVEYAFGDWNYAALNHDWPNDAVGALLISFKSALGRRFLDPCPLNGSPIITGRSPDRLQVLYISQQAVEQVCQDLDNRYRQDAAKPKAQIVHNPETDLDFVPDDEHYSFLNNCNDLTARCLRQMGCQLKGVVGFSKFYVINPNQNPALPTLATTRPVLPTARVN